MPGTTMKRLRAEKEVTQAQIAEATGLPQSSVSDFESGKRHPLPHQLRALAAYFGVTEEEMGFGKDESCEVTAGYTVMVPEGGTMTVTLPPSNSPTTIAVVSVKKENR